MRFTIAAFALLLLLACGCDSLAWLQDQRNQVLTTGHGVSLLNDDQPADARSR